MKVTRPDFIYFRAKLGNFLHYVFNHFSSVRDEDVYSVKEHFEFFSGEVTILSLLVVSRAGKSTSKDLSSRNSSGSFPGALPTPEAFIH